MSYILQKGEQTGGKNKLGKRKIRKILTTMYSTVPNSLIPHWSQIKFPHNYIYLDLYNIVTLPAFFPNSDASAVIVPVHLDPAVLSLARVPFQLQPSAWRTACCSFL